MLTGWPDWLWTDERGALTSAPEAWATGRLWLRDQAPQLEGIQLRRDTQLLNLLLVQQAGGRRLVAEWPAAEPGFHRVSWRVPGKQPAETLVFTGLRHLQPAEWIALLAELHWELPSRLLWSFKMTQGLVPLRSRESTVLPSPQNSLGLLLALWEGGLHGQPGFRQLLTALAHTEPALLPQAGFYKLNQLRRWPTALLYRDPRQETLPRAVWGERLLASLDTPRHQWVAATVQRLDDALRLAQNGLWRIGQAESAARLQCAQHELRQHWQRHPLRDVVPARPVSGGWEGDPVVQRCRTLHRVLDQELTPALGGPAWVAAQPFALLYQHWCLLQLAQALQRWAQVRGVQSQHLAKRLQAGRPLLVLSSEQEEISLIPEASYTQQGEWISLSHLQRPDISLRIHAPGQESRLIVCDTKFRRGPSGPLKDDLDKLHAYRDAIRHADGRFAVHRAVLLYPGPERHYHQALSAWTARPGAALTRWDVLLEQLLRA